MLLDQLEPLLEEDIDPGITKWDIDETEDYDVNKNRSSFITKPGRLTSSSTSSGVGGGGVPTLIKYPKEKGKTIVAFGLLGLGLILNSLSIALVHDRVPDRDKYPPLPDAVLDNIRIFPDLMKVPDVFVFLTVAMVVVVVALHSHRWIVARRVFFILFLLYVLRSITMYVTVLPISNYTVYCSPKSANGTTAGIVFQRMYELMAGGGMQISGQKKTCGDYIYSGHTAILMVGYLLIKEYSPKGLSILPWISFFLSWSGMGILLIARGHYTIDVLIGYYISTTLFWTYHSIANSMELKTKSARNFHSNVWWYPILMYLEGNVDGPLPKEYSLPWTPGKNFYSPGHRLFNLAVENDKIHSSLTFTFRKV